MKTLIEQLGTKNKEFGKFQEETARHITQINENNQKQLKAQAAETAKHKAEIAALYEKNLKAAINSETASLNAKIEWSNKENQRLRSELEKKKSNFAL
ncbi:hypothetical protein [Chryseobacterium sp.]|uniref:hypothetical protein n=1 Tax=Chryseobacterium sp. TaxID=1871047 RepID=UPI0012A9C8BE|nr:hypothetical protein [Chryseobacterium sp.]QFG53190.1 hypothetical protein F7R58_06400 [Chryseobacterium sp.]